MNLRDIDSATLWALLENPKTTTSQRVAIRIELDWREGVA